jgi:hypothetical protein
MTSSDCQDIGKIFQRMATEPWVRLEAHHEQVMVLLSFAELGLNVMTDSGRITEVQRIVGIDTLDLIAAQLASHRPELLEFLDKQKADRQ